MSDSQKSSPLWEWSSLAACGLLLAAGAMLQAQVHLNHDVAWILHGARWMLEGAQIGRDIIDVNPPLIWFVSLPAAGLANAGLFSEPDALRIYVWTLCVASLLLCHRVLRPLRAQGAGAESAALLLGAAYAMAILPGGAFAQREHLAFVLGLPYCLLLAERLRGDDSPPSALAIACGVFAGVAFGFKPWFLAVPLLLEIAHFAKIRVLRRAFRPESLALGATVFAYLLAVLLFAREYLTVVMPMGVATYWAYDGSLPAWFHLRNAGFAFAVALAFLAIARRFSALALGLCLTVLGFAFSHWAQHKGFLYHAYPTLAAAATLLAYAIVPAVRRLASVTWQIAGWARIALATVPVMIALHCVRVSYLPVLDWARTYAMRGNEIGGFRSELIEKIDAIVPRGGYVYAFSTHPFPAFPTMSYTAAEWGSPMVAQFATPAFAVRDQVRDPEKLAALDQAVRAQREQVLRDFERHRPAMVFVARGPNRLGMQGREFDDVAFYTADPRFAAIWRQYTETGNFGGMRVFLRLEPGAQSQPCPDSNTK